MLTNQEIAERKINVIVTLDGIEIYHQYDKNETKISSAQIDKNGHTSFYWLKKILEHHLSIANEMLETKNFQLIKPIISSSIHTDDDKNSVELNKASSSNNLA
jgi:hypothetical protein